MKRKNSRRAIKKSAILSAAVAGVGLWAGAAQTAQAGAFLDTINWTGDSVLTLSSSKNYTAAVDFNNASNYTTYGDIKGVSFQRIPNSTNTGTQNYAPSGTTLGSWEIAPNGYTGMVDVGFVTNTDNRPSGTGTTESQKLATNCAYRYTPGSTGVYAGPDIKLTGLQSNTDYVFELYAPVYFANYTGLNAARGLRLTPSDGGGTYQDFTQGGATLQTAAPQIIRYQYNTGAGTTFTMNVDFLNGQYPGIIGGFTNQVVPEPGTIASVLGLGSLTLLRRRRNRKV